MQGQRPVAALVTVPAKLMRTAEELVRPKKTAAPFRGRRLSWKANGMIQLRAVAIPAGGASPV